MTTTAEGSRFLACPPSDGIHDGVLYSACRQLAPGRRLVALSPGLNPTPQWVHMPARCAERLPLNCRGPAQIFFFFFSLWFIVPRFSKLLQEKVFRRLLYQMCSTLQGFCRSSHSRFLPERLSHSDRGDRAHPSSSPTTETKSPRQDLARPSAAACSAIDPPA